MVQEAVDAYSNLSDSDKKEFRRQLAADLPHPTGWWLGFVWLLVVVGLFAVFFAGGWAIWNATGDKDIQFFVTTASAALGALVGLLAPSPVRTGTP